MSTLASSPRPPAPARSFASTFTVSIFEPGYSFIPSISMFAPANTLAGTSMSSLAPGNASLTFPVLLSAEAANVVPAASPFAVV